MQSEPSCRLLVGRQGAAAHGRRDGRDGKRAPQEVAPVETGCDDFTHGEDASVGVGFTSGHHLNLPVRWREGGPCARPYPILQVAVRKRIMLVP